MRELAEALHCDASNITGIVDRLERRGLVDRQVSAVDRRVKALVVTEEGRHLREALFARLADGAPPAVALTARERSTLAALLAKVAAVGPVADPACIPLCSVATGRAEPDDGAQADRGGPPSAPPV